MKIEINQNESYEIAVPSKMSIDEFHAFLGKLDSVAKIIKTNLVVGETFKEFKERYNNRGKIAKEKFKETRFKIGAGKKDPNFDTKEKAMDIMQYFYHGTQEDRNRIAMILEKNPSEIGKKFHNQIKRYDIQPSEVGFVRFANKIMKLDSIKEKDYIIKSYTGLFDEPEN